MNQEIKTAVLEILKDKNDTSINTLEEAILNFNTFYQNVKKESTEEITPYGITINCDLSFSNKKMVSILLDFYVSSRGEECQIIGNKYLTIDRKTGKVITTLLKDYDQFIELVEKEFRKEYNISEDVPINNSRFQLPSTIGIIDNHVVLYYNQYEMGTIELLIPKRKAAPFFALNIL